MLKPAGPSLLGGVKTVQTALHVSDAARLAVLDNPSFWHPASLCSLQFRLLCFIAAFGFRGWPSFRGAVTSNSSVWWQSALG